MRRLLLLFAAAAVLSRDCAAIFQQPEPAPVERLLKKAQTYLSAHQGEAEAHYTLGRIHYLAFALGTRAVPAFRDTEDAGKPSLPADWLVDFDLYEARKKHARELALKDIGERGPEPPAEKLSAFEEARGKRSRQLEAQNWRPRGSLPPPEMLAHAAAALNGFRMAANLDPKNGLYQLGIASLAEQFSAWERDLKPGSVPPELRGLSTIFARDTYLRAYRMAIAGDASLPSLPLGGWANLVSHEAGIAFLRLSETDPAKVKTHEKAAIDEVKAGLKKLKKLRLGAITPIVLSLQPASGLPSLLAPNRTVQFDLRGFGPRQRWTWVGPRAGLLVWDPERTGRIDSARQLFGNFTFGIFWANGYAALAALDDNGDGQLSGDELQGVRVWFDSDGDGQASPGEVHDLCEFGIASIATTAAGREGPHPTNPAGVTFTDGRKLPTWDWIAHPRP